MGEAIRRFKYGRRSELARPLGRAIVHALPERSCVHFVAPIPLHVHRLRERGFDQAVLLARSVARGLQRPLEVDLLERVVETPQLATLNAEKRRLAVERAFVARACLGARILLVDDVHTTGATISAAAHAVRRNGRFSRAHVLAATPKE